MRALGTRDHPIAAIGLCGIEISIGMLHPLIHIVVEPQWRDTDTDGYGVIREGI